MTEDELVTTYLLDGDFKKANRAWLLDVLLELVRRAKAVRVVLRPWSTEGLFGHHSDENPSVIENLGKQGQGRPTVYLDGSLSRLDYLLEAGRVGHGPKQIKKALTMDLPQDALFLWINEKVWRYIAARQLAILLTLDAVLPESQEATFVKLWSWSPEFDAKFAELKAANPMADEIDLEGMFLKDFKNRNLVPLSLYFEPPESPAAYFAGLEDADAAGKAVQAFRQLVEAVRTDTDGDEVWKAAEAHLVDGYKIFREDLSIKGQSAGRGLPDFYQPRSMTLLEFGYSHLQLIRDEVNEWLRRCPKCGNYFAMADPQQRRCKKWECQKL